MRIQICGGSKLDSKFLYQNHNIEHFVIVQISRYRVTFFFLALFQDEPRNLTVTNIKSRSADISWIEPETKGDGFKEFLVKLKKNSSLIWNTTTTMKNYTLDNLTPSTTYAITVAAKNKHNFSKEINASFTTCEEGKVYKNRNSYSDNSLNYFSI